ncbi:glutamate--trna ligase [Holotrichia oblita]|nr:glutamate--trna ligase [Holotrichia oblita]
MENNNKKPRLRFAPSPTGFMHLGVLRTALYDYLYAKKYGGTFILRIEDTDQARYVEGATEVIYNTLKECGLNWDEGPDIGGKYAPYIQSERNVAGTYIKYAKQLVEEGKAYFCFCDKERMDSIHKLQAENGETPHYDRHCRNISKEEAESLLNKNIPYVIRQKIPETEAVLSMTNYTVI